MNPFKLGNRDRNMKCHKITNNTQRAQHVKIQNTQQLKHIQQNNNEIIACGRENFKDDENVEKK